MKYYLYICVFVLVSMFDMGRPGEARVRRKLAKSPAHFTGGRATGGAAARLASVVLDFYTFIKTTTQEIVFFFSI